MGKRKRRFVARSVPGGYRIWNTKMNKWWGDTYDYCPDALLAELNGERRPDKVTALLTKTRKAKR